MQDFSVASRRGSTYRFVVAKPAFAYFTKLPWLRLPVFRHCCNKRRYQSRWVYWRIACAIKRHQHPVYISRGIRYLTETEMEDETKVLDWRYVRRMWVDNGLTPWFLAGCESRETQWRERNRSHQPASTKSGKSAFLAVLPMIPVFYCVIVTGREYDPV